MTERLAIYVDGSNVYFAATDGRIYAVDRKSGKQTWTYEAAGGFVGSPAIADGRMVIASDEGVVFCFGKSK